MPSVAEAGTLAAVPLVSGIRPEFVILALTLLGIALFYKRTMLIAFTGLALVLCVKLLFIPGFSVTEQLIGTAGRAGEWKILLNLTGLLLGFAILAKYFEESGIPAILPDILPGDWKGGLVLLFLIMLISAFLDNIAAAMIGGSIAMVVFKGKLHMGFLAAIVAASNAGGAGSVLGDTTTTMMWISGVGFLTVLHAFIASLAAFAVFGTIAARQQYRFQRIQKDVTQERALDYGKLAIVIMMLIAAVVTNRTLGFPAAGVWAVIILASVIRKVPWKVLPNALQGTLFLVPLVACASLMPVEALPKASWQSTFILGFLSAVFDNIPLTKLCLEQGGYDWGLLAYAVGFGGSMIWFGSSAGVALSGMYPESKSAVNYVKGGWHVALAYIAGFFVILGLSGWHPETLSSQPVHQTEYTATHLLRPESQRLVN